MTNFSAGDKTQAINTTVTMAANSDGSTIDVGAYLYTFLNITWTGADAADGSAHLEVSPTGAAGTWETYPNSNYIMTTAAGSHSWDVELHAIPYIRIAYLAGSNAAGTFSTTARVEVPA